MMTFVTCSEESCPSNCLKSCRAKALSVGAKAECEAFAKKVDKSLTDNYVDVEGCAVSKCDHWEIDEATNKGKCGFSGDLHFSKMEGAPPICMEFKTQIGQPGFAANV